jgi:dTDP-D-glucose 4,6-dehydratase
MKIIVTGGAGFIGSCFVRLALQSRSLEIANLDKQLTRNLRSPSVFSLS